MFTLIINSFRIIFKLILKDNAQQNEERAIANIEFSKTPIANIQKTFSDPQKTLQWIDTQKSVLQTSAYKQAVTQLNNTLSTLPPTAQAQQQAMFDLFHQQTVAPTDDKAFDGLIKWLGI
jgi:hypothetical protein